MASDPNAQTPGTALKSGAGGRFIEVGDVRFDRVEGRLTRGDVEVSLRAKSLAVLRHLAANAGRVVSRAELLRAVWGGRAVSPSVVRVSVRELREALGRDAIQTVGRQGYRFAPDGSDVRLATPVFVGRDGELARLHDLFERCRTRQPLQVFVSGEPGIGKSALIERFVTTTGAHEQVRIARGQCVDLHGSTEPYLPILEAFERLCQDQDVWTTLERQAPSWLLQMPSLVDAETADSLRRRVPDPTRDRMLREFAVALETLARDKPLVFVLEDLHWADASTTDLLAYLGERATPAKLLVLGSYRPAGASAGAHPLRDLVQRLVARRRGIEVVVEPLSRDDVEQCLSRLLPGGVVDERVADTLHERTDGNPLFLTATVEYLSERGSLSAQDGRWQLGAGADSVPPSLRELVGRELDSLDAESRALLKAASVVGLDFDATSVAAAMDMPADHIEQRCAELASAAQLVRATGTMSWPDETISGTYRFLHGLHRDAVYDGVPPAERARLHRAIAECLEAGWGEEAGRVAAALALHFERGLDLARAVQHHMAAANAAKARLADREVVAHAEAVQSILPKLPPSPERDATEAACLLTLGPSLINVQGFGLAPIQELFDRARHLAASGKDVEAEFLAQGGLYLAEVTGGDQRRALAIAGELLAFSDRFPVPLFAVIGNTASGTVHYNLGQLTQAHEHFARAREAWQPDLPRIHPDQKVLFLGIGALALQQLGDPATERWHDELLAYAHDVDDPKSIAHAFNLIAPWHLWAQDRPRALEHAQRALAISDEHGFLAHGALARFLCGVARDDPTLQQEAFGELQAGGVTVNVPTHRLQMARTLLALGRHDEARQILDLAIGAIENNGESRHLAEVHRARAECEIAAGRHGEAELALRSALSVAREQEARLFETWASADLERLPSAR